MELKEFSFIDSTTISGRLIELSKRTMLNGIESSTLTDCEIVLNPRGLPTSRSGSRFHIKKNVLERCVIRAEGLIHALNIAETVKLRECKFEGGPFREAAFGSGTLSDSENVELLEMCDFTECDLRDARFFSTSLEQVVLPAWPHISVVSQDGGQLYAPPSHLYPAFTKLYDDVREFPWTDSELGKSLEFMVMAVGERPRKPTITVHHAEDIVKHSSCSIEFLKLELDRFAHPALRY